MKPDRFRQIDALFDEVLDATTLERNEILTEKCAGDADMKNKVLALISKLKTKNDFIENSGTLSVSAFVKNEPDKYVGKKYGAYKLKALLGQGGMSSVYLALREDDYEKEVAIKIFAPLENRQTSAENFRRERQILASLAHPNIAQIVDGGSTHDGEHYIVMEYVDGLPLNEYCAKNNLCIEQKLKLFRVVCSAVIFAHRNLIVHRDLKPYNILINNYGIPKLLDFGIAKLLATNTTGIPENTTLNGNAFTLEYASPEQITGENITVASDVYSLGVVLYELLTGRRPHELQNKSLREIVRIVENIKPVPPSKIEGSDFKVIDTELDAVVLKSLEKSLSERYQTADEFCSDLEKYLKKQPVSAKSPTKYYRLIKFMQRNVIESSVAFLVVFLVGGWFATYVWTSHTQSLRARENRRTAYSAEMTLAANEYENSNLNRLREIVEKYRTVKNGEEDLRGFEWYFLNGLLNPSSRIKVFPHPDEIWSAKYSPDSRYIATASNDNRIRVFDLKTNQILVSREQAGAWRIAFYPDGKRFAVASSSKTKPLVRIYETSTLKELFTLNGFRKRVRAVAVSPDGKSIATGDQEGNLKIWDADNGRELRTLEFDSAQKETEVSAVKFSRNGKKLAALGNETLILYKTGNWSMKSADKTQLIDRNLFLSGWEIEFSPLDKAIAVGTFEGDVLFFDAESVNMVNAIKFHNANVKSLTFSPDGKTLATGSWDRTVKFVSYPAGELQGELRGHFAGVHDVGFSSNGKMLLTAGADFNLNLWNSEFINKENSLNTSAAKFAFSKDGTRGYGWDGLTKELSAYNTETKRKLWNVNDPMTVFSVDHDQISKIVVAGEKDGYISVFDANNGKKLHRYRPYEKTVYSIKISGDGKTIYSGYEDGVLKATNFQTGEEFFSIAAGAEILKFIVESPDQRFLVTGGNAKEVWVIDSKSGIELKRFGGHKKPLYTGTLSNDGTLLVTTGAEDFGAIHRVSDWTLTHKISGTSGGIFAAAFSPDGRRLATASDIGRIRVWDVESGQQVLAFTADNKQITNLKFTGDGKTLMSINAAGKLKFWEGPSGS